MVISVVSVVHFCSVDGTERVWFMGISIVWCVHLRTAGFSNLGWFLWCLKLKVFLGFFASWAAVWVALRGRKISTDFFVVLGLICVIFVV